MKKIIFLSAICLIFSFLSCEKQGSTNPPANTGTPMTQAPSTQAPAVPVEPKAPAVEHGFVIRAQSGIYSISTVKERETAKYLDGINLGEKVELKNGGTTKKAFYNNDEFEFVEVRRETGVTGWVINYQVARGGQLAVVTYDQKANVYKSPRNTDVTSSILTPKTILVVYPESEAAGFIKFSTYDPEVKRYFTDQFIKSSVISTRDSDIQSSILLQLALLEKQAVRREALLQSAEDFRDSIFNQEISNILNPPPKEAQFSSAGTLYLNESDVNVYTSADEANGEVTGKLEKGTAVTVDRETIDSYSVNDSFAKWYHITSPVAGWIFGSYLDSTPPAE